MMRLTGAALILATLATLYATNASVLVWRSAVVDRGEGGPAFECYYLGAMGLARVGYFYSGEPERATVAPASRSDCALLCVLEKHQIRIDTRNITAMSCAHDAAPR